MVLGPGIRARPFESASTLRSAFAVAVCASSMIRWHLILMAPSGGVLLQASGSSVHARMTARCRASLSFRTAICQASNSSRIFGHSRVISF
jgi:hypothetical protein